MVLGQPGEVAVNGFGRRRLLQGGLLGAAAGVFGTAGPARSRARAWRFPEHRTAARLAVDSAHARRQVEALSSAAGRERASRIIDRLRARQDAGPARYALPFDRRRSAGSGAEVLVARGDLGVIVPLGHVIKGDDHPIVTQPPAAPPVIVPLGHTIKGDDHPIVTQPPVAPPPIAPAPVRVALVDTGLPAGPRGDGWLTEAVAGPGHTDPLDVMPAAGRLDWGAGHGTFTAGIVQQVAPRCEIVAYRFTRGDGLGTDADAAAMLLRAAEDGHRAGVRTVINASFGAPALDGSAPPALRAAVEFIHAAYPGVVIVASAGNMGDEEPMYPAAFDQVVSVGALTSELRPAPFSSFGPWVRCATVGVGVVSTFVPGVSPPEPDPRNPDQVFGADAWAMWSGTSFSAPQISGALARLCCEDAGLSPRAAVDALLAGRPEIDGYGRVLRLLPGTPT
jgi:hypothetical protein